MANQPESPSFDAGVYQLETVDPVQGGAGGVSNVPLLALSNRTRWLKDQVDALVAAVALKAPIASPTLTGDPKAPTPPAGDSDTSIATTAFVQAAVNGITAKNVAGSGNLVLTAAEAGAFLYVLTGALTGARNVIFPASKARQAVIFNATTGSFALTVKHPTGAGVAVQQGRLLHVVLDGSDARRGTTDFHDAALTGDPTAPTPAFGDNDTSIATTAFVQAAVAAAGAWSTGDIKATLKTSADAGWVLMNDGTIGNGSSGASARANDDCAALFTHIWNAIPDAWAPVVGGRGGSAEDDWNANRRITLPRALGRALASAGAGAGLTSRTLGSYTGTEAHALAISEMPNHDHDADAAPAGRHLHTGSTDPSGRHQHRQGSESLYADFGGGTYIGERTYVQPSSGTSYRNQNTSEDGEHGHTFTTSEVLDHDHLVTVGSRGGGAAHPNVQPTFFVNFMIKL